MQFLTAVYASVIDLSGNNEGGRNRTGTSRRLRIL